LLKSRFAEFENDAGFLAELCQLLLPLEKAVEAFLWAKKRVNLARSTDELKPAIELAAAVAARTGDAAGLIEKLANEKIRPSSASAFWLNSDQKTETWIELSQI